MNNAVNTKPVTKSNEPEALQEEDYVDTPQLNRLVEVFIKIRDAREALVKQNELAVKQLDEQLDTIRHALLDHCKANGVEGGRTTAGTFSRSVKKRYWTSDWTALHAFILEHKLPDLLEKRLHQTNMKQLLEEQPDLVPPGLNVDSEYVINVRRAR